MLAFINANDEEVIRNQLNFLKIYRIRCDIQNNYTRKYSNFHILFELTFSDPPLLETKKTRTTTVHHSVHHEPDVNSPSPKTSAFTSAFCLEGTTRGLLQLKAGGRKAEFGSSVWQQRL